MALHRAAAEGNVSKVRKLLDKGKDVNALQSDDGHTFTPLVSAVVEKQPACVELLLERGAHADGKGTDSTSYPSVTPLMIACMVGDARSTLALVKHGATLNAADPEGFAALHHACHAGHSACVEVLLAAQADRTRRCGGNTPLEIAQNEGHAACVAAFDDDRLQLPVTLLSNGSRVRIVGLVSKPEHNGKLAEVTTFVSESGRYTVSLSAPHSGSINVKPQNVVVAEEELPETPRPVRQCASCGAVQGGAVKLQMCGKCKDLRRVDGPWYCGRECQKADWKRGHKAFHRELAKVEALRCMREGILGSKMEAAREHLAASVIEDDFDSSYESVVNTAMDTFMNKKDPKGAAKLLRQAIALSPDLARGYLVLGTVLQQQRQFLDAMLEYGKGLARLPPGGEEWARTTLAQLSCMAETVGGKWIRPRREIVAMEQTPEWFHNPHEQIKLAVKCCIALPDNAQAWHWRASMLAFLSRQSSEAARCWRRGAEFAEAMFSDVSYKENMLRWAHETETGTGEPPVPGIWEDE